MLKAICESFVPKLIAEDIILLSSLLQGVFPGSGLIPLEDDAVKSALQTLAPYHNLVPNNIFIEKVLQLNQILKIHHGIIMVGPSGSGKSAA